MKVGIVGLGLIGASFAKAYKENSDQWEVYGWNRTETVTEMAKMQGIIDDYLTDDNLPLCDLVILSLYPEASIKWMEDHKDHFNKEGLVIDACGTKRLICKEGFRIASECGFTFVGCHPMAGTKYSGMKYARANMYKGAPMVICPAVYDDMSILDRIIELLKPCGFETFRLAHPDEHDRMIAFTSQMAHLVSNAYIKSPNALSHSGFSAGSYKDMTRVAWLNPEMWTQLFLENKDNLIFEIDNIIEELKKYREAMVNDDHDELVRLLAEGRDRKELVDGK
ncbi:MAG: prephenate dehydrogenase [Clostridiales bacterium]|nr:prephenate dehydrogenase [Clostridiales bacterium]